MNSFSLIQTIAVWIIPVLLAITLHEAAHAYAAYRLGDPTAKMLGRLSLNPLKHICPIGTILVPLLIGLSTNFSYVFGWAKPIPISPRNFKSAKRDNALVAIAGPLSNLVMAIAWAVLMKIALTIGPNSSSLSQFLLLSGRAGIIINTLLMALNLLPIPPLDGSRVVSALLPGKYDYYYSKLENYGLYILVILMLTGILSTILRPIFSVSITIISTIVGIG